MRFKTLAIALALVAVATCALAQTVAPVVVAPSPATTHAIVDAASWSKLVDQIFAAIGTVLGLAVTTGIGFGVQYLRQKSAIARVVLTDSIVNRVEKGAIGIINSEAERLRQKVNTPDDVNDPDVRKVITENATVKVAENFKESLQTLGVTAPNKIEDFVRGRVEKALAKPVEIPAVVARS